MANFWDSIFGSAIAANFVLASPNGASGPLTPRALVFADLPAIPTGTILWSQLGNAAADLTLANSTFNTTFNQTSAVNWTWANTTAATATSAFAYDGSSLSGWTNTGVTVDAALGNPLPSFKVPTTKNANINAGVAAGQTLQFDFYATVTSSLIFSFQFGCNSSGNGPRFRLDGRGAFPSGFSIGATGSFPSDGAPNTASKILATPTASTWHRVHIVIASDGLSASWYLDGVFQATGALAGGILGGYISIYEVSAGDVWIDNISGYSSVTASNSPILKISGAGWDGAASAADYWTVQNLPATGSSPSTLDFVPTSANITSARLRAPNLALTTALNVLNGGTVNFAGTTGFPDVGISRVRALANSLGVGDGSFGSYSGVLYCGQLLLPATANGADWGIALTPASRLSLTSALPITWGASNALSAQDTGISRIGAASLAIGNGTAGSFTGSLKLTTLTLQGLVGTYNAIATVSNGVPAEYATVDLTAQTADIGATTMYAVPAAGAGMYRVSVYIVVSQAATTSSTLPKVQIKWTDNDNNTVQTSDVTVINSGNALTTFEAGVQILNVKASTNIQYVTTGTATSGGTALNYALHLKLEAM